jgi:hypothetical protein
MQRKSGEDLRFGGWRDWLLLLIGVPVFLGALYAGAMLAVGSKSGSGVLLSPAGGLVVAAIALVVGLLLGRSPAARRWLQRQ